MRVSANALEVARSVHDVPIFVCGFVSIQVYRFAANGARIRLLAGCHVMK